MGIGQNWNLGSIAPGQEKEFGFTLKGWNLTSGLTAQVGGGAANISLLKSSFTPNSGILDDVLMVRVVAPQNQGVKTALITITGGGIANPANRKLWVQYDVNPYQNITEISGKKISVLSLGNQLRITSDIPANLLISSLDGRIMAQEINSGFLSQSLESGIYLLTVDEKTSKYIHIVK